MDATAIAVVLTALTTAITALCGGLYKVGTEILRRERETTKAELLREQALATVEAKNLELTTVRKELDQCRDECERSSSDKDRIIALQQSELDRLRPLTEGQG